MKFKRLVFRCFGPFKEQTLDLSAAAGLHVVHGPNEAGKSVALRGLRAKVGCKVCRNTGYVGRTTISELLIVTDAVRERMLQSGTEAAIQAAALEGGMITMFEDGLAKAVRGETTIDEVLRVTRMS